MKTRITNIALVGVCCLFLGASAHGDVTRGWKLAGGTFREYEFATDFYDLSESVTDTDLINGFGVCVNGLPIDQGINESAIAPFTYGWIDPYNGYAWNTIDPDGLDGVGSWLMKVPGDDCLSIDYQNPSNGFYNPAVYGDMPDLVDGQPQSRLTEDTYDYRKTVLRDFGRAALVVRYGFSAPTDIGRIRIFAANLDRPEHGNAGRMSRIFQYYDVYARTGDCSGGACPAGPGMADGFDEFFLVAERVTTGEPGWVSNNPAQNPTPWEGTMTDVVNFNSNTLIAGCTDLRLVLYCVGNTDGFFMDPWQGSHNMPPDYQIVCPDVTSNGTPTIYYEELVVQTEDGYRKAFEAPIIKEIDVFGPTPTPWGDIDYDGDRDMIDFGAFQDCFLDDVTTNGCYRFDYEPDADVDVADYIAFEAQMTGP